MKKILSLLTLVLAVALGAIGQAPGIFNYQGVARNSVGNVLINKTINLRLTIHDGSAAGATVYQESRLVNTNPFGLFNAQVGSAGASNVTGTIAGVPWGIGAKFIQVEIDPNGGTTFINIGTAQIASVPYALYANQAGDLVLPFIRTQASAATTLIGLTNSATTGTAGAIQGTSASTDGNAVGLQGTISSTTPGGFSAGVRGVNNGTGGLGIGVYGSQAGSGWGVYGVTPNGFGVNGISTTSTGVNGSSTSGTGVAGASTSGSGVTGTSGTGNAGRFVTNTPGTTNPAVFVSTDATGGNAFGVQSVITSTSPGGFSAAVRGQNSGTGGLGIGIWGSHDGSGWGVYGTAVGGIGVNGSASSGIGVNGTSNTGTGGRFTTTSGLALHTTGGVRLQGINEGASRVLTSDATGNATWQTLGGGVGIGGSGTLNFIPKWTPDGTNLGNSQFFDNGTNVGLATTAPTHRLTVQHAGSTGIMVTSTAGFSVMDVNAQNGDAAIRLGNNGTNQWNFRNRPGDNYLEWFELGGGGSRMVIQDGTGNVGIGETANPTYRLDVLHGGSTGIRSRSSGSFSVVDIDAASGDAALRFANAGVNQWNMRNRPGDNYLEWFELGGGGSRMVIQDGTGNVGIGETTSPSYRLDVLHGGSTGIRSRSSASFSVVDIDGASGDAALRFANNGVNQWNIRNRPADDYLEIFELGGGGSRVVVQDGTGNVGIGETTSPSYKLDVLHGGATGIRSRSNSTFSLVDIDAANGDAALRFAKAGVNQWNVRNRPADDYFEIFELGGGGSRVVIQDGTGNVGIGETTSPSYKLDVLHGGATGIRSRSNSTFSLMDIDAANGDAALRFAKAGVNQWNTRNRPADDYYEIFELGGGGSRVVIQDGTGNVGIGETTNPTYRLDVLHGGATGARVRSSATFSILDIDGFNGDAALRFAKNGVNQWNIRNNPATDDLQFFELGGGGERMRIDNTTGKVWVDGDFTALGVKLFTMDHPLDPENKILMHAAAESNEVINFYSGNVTTDASGKAIVQLPDYYQALNKDSRYQLTVIGSFAQAIISKEVANNQFEIATSTPNVKVSWEVKGVRNDNHMKQHPFVAVEEKSAAQKGKFLDPAAHNQPASKGVGYVAGPSSLDYTAPVNTKAAPATTGGSLEQGAIVAPVTPKAVVQGTSLEQQPITTNNDKKIDNTNSSVSPENNQNKNAKPAVKPDVKGTSVEDAPKATEKKAATTEPAVSSVK